MVGETYGKFSGLERLSLSSLIDKLSLIGNIKYSMLYHDLMIRKAKKVEHRIDNIGDLNKYYLFLKKEIDAREKKYLIEPH